MARFGDARRKATNALTIYRHPKTKQYMVYIGSGKGPDQRIALLASFPSLNKETKAQINAIKDTIAGLLAGLPATKYRVP